jgi:hypothetical protein
MGNFDVTTPTGATAINLVDDRIREMKLAIQEALRGGTTEGDEAVFPGAAPTTAPIFHYRGLKGTTGSRPTAGPSGLYFDTDRQSLQRDNGATWDDIASVFPAGTKMIFTQNSVPAGWTLYTDVNDSVLRIVSTTGGGTGGSAGVAAGITLAHSHTVASHTHSISSDGAHTHTTTHTHGISSAAIDHKHYTPTINNVSNSQIYGVGETPFGHGGDATGVNIGTFLSRVGPQSDKQYQKTDTMINYAGGNTDSTAAASDSQGAHTHGGASGAAAPSTDSQLSNFTLKYYDAIVGIKS